MKGQETVKQWDGAADGIDAVVDPRWLLKHLDDVRVVVADCRFDLADPEAGRRQYEEGHIPGAVFFDLDKDLSRPAAGSGGRHPLPPLDEFVAALTERGIGEGTAVVCYDDSGGGMAARLWWMLRYIGHEAVALLDGGWSAWVRGGLPVARSSSGRPPVLPASRPVKVRLRTDMAADAPAVRRIVEKGGGVIVDSRAPERWRGETEPLDPVAGRIPGSVNYPWQQALDDEGRMPSPETLARRFQPLAGRGDVVVHCGSGVTGCLNVLAMKRAGLEGVRLYVGGWSDWCSDADNPVATGPPEVHSP